MKVHRWKTITALAAAASLALAIGAAPSQAATLVESTKVSAGLSASDLSKLPLTDRHLTARERANLAVVLRAYHAGEGDVLDAQGFMDLFAKDGVLNGIGGVEGQTSLRGQQLGNLILFLGHSSFAVMPLGLPRPGGWSGFLPGSVVRVERVEIWWR